MLKQIILISDGRSNAGPDPSDMAELALNENIIVNTIGIIDNRQDKTPVLELETVAKKGGGICELTDLDNLSQTLSKITVNSIYGTVEEMVRCELQDMLDTDVVDFKPSERHKFIKLIDKIGNEASLKCLILLDVSGSMKKKINIARKSIFELLIFLEERKGENEIGVMVFPGRTGYYELLCDFTTDINELRKRIEVIETGGITPTGSAIEGAITTFMEDKYEYTINEHIV